MFAINDRNTIAKIKQNNTSKPNLVHKPTVFLLGKNINFTNGDSLTISPKVDLDDETAQIYQKGLQNFLEFIKAKKSDVNINEFREAYLQLSKITDAIGEKAGFKKQTITPRMLVTDGYTIANEGYISQDAKDFSAYQITFRRAQAPWMAELGVKSEDSKYIFMGVQDIINEFLYNPVTKEEIDEAAKFLEVANYGKPFKWDRGPWDRVVKERNGIIPIKIEALPEGSVVFPGEPVIQISSEKGYGELAAWFETKLLQVWAASERASLLRHWLNYNKELVRRCTNETLSDEQITAKAQNMLVDFGDRSSMNSQESERLGEASLTSFPTTSTVSAAYKAYKDSGNQSVSKLSMPSLAHRTVQSYDEEGKAYRALYEFTKGGIGSHVADCYDFKNAVAKYLVPLALEAVREQNNTIICARPDSGDPLEEMLFVLDKAVENGLYKEVTARDGKKLKAMTNLRVIQADGMGFKKMKEINEALIEKGYSPPDCVYYGVGGSLHDDISRSNLSVAQKLCSVGLEKRPVMKCPIGEKGKESIPGMVKVVRGDNNESTVRTVAEDGKNEFVALYDGINGSGIQNHESFKTIQQRVIKDFDKHKKPKEIFSSDIKDLKSKLIAEHRVQYDKTRGSN